MAAQPKHSHGRYVLCPPDCPRAGMSDGPCSVCGAASDPMALVATGGGHDYPVCGKSHGQSLWDYLDATQAAEENGLPEPPAIVRFPPDWIQLEGGQPHQGTPEHLSQWLAVPAHAKALADLRGD